MPSAKKFMPSLHPRDRHGRFTRSHSVHASTAERALAADTAKGMKPKRGIGGAKAGDYLRTVDGGHQETVGKYVAGGYVDVHQALRAGKTDSPDVKAMDAAMVPLPDDLIVSRRVPKSAFGDLDLKNLEGFKVADAAYSPTSIGTVRATQTDVRMRIAVPKGTRAAVNPDTGEVILDRDLEMVVAKADGGDLYLTVLPKAGAHREVGKASKAAPVVAPAKAEPKDHSGIDSAGADQPAGGDAFRTQLMKTKVPDLQAQMRERGLKPGKLRKTELVEALIADETGGDHAHPDAAKAKPAEKVATGTPEDQVRSAVDDIIRADGGTAGDWVSITRLRAQTPELSKPEFDAAVKALHRQPGVNVEGRPDRWALNQADHDAAVTIAGEPRHLIAIRKPAGSVKAAADPLAGLLQQQWQQARDSLLAGWSATAQPLVDELAGQAEAASLAGDLAALGGLQASAGVVTALAAPLAESGTKLARQAAAGVVAEAADAKVPITAPAGAGAERVRQTADAVAQIIARGYASGAARISLQLAGSDPGAVRAEVERQLGNLSQSHDGLVGDNVGQLLSAAQHAGRLAVLELHPAKAYEAVEVNDHAKCEPCSRVDLTRYRTLKAALADYPAAGFRGCLGGSRCRGHVRPVWG